MGDCFSPLAQLAKSPLSVPQARSFAALLEQTIRRYQNRAIEAAQVIEELIQIAKGAA